MTSVPKVRWWPVWVILALCGGLLGWIWLFREQTRQYQVMSSLVVVFLGAVLLFLWLVLLSRLRWRTRLAWVGVLSLVALAAASLVEVRGFTGDVLPILEWTWQAGEPERPDVERTSAAVAPELDSGSWPQFLGPGRNGRLPDVHLARDWSANPPREIWRREIGAGWASFAVVGNIAVTLEQRGSEELVVAYDLRTGEVVWVHADETRYEGSLGGVGPRTTPTVDGDRVFTLGATGILNALELTTGRPIWSRNVVEENDAVAPEWGKSCSPLVVDGLVVVSAGGGDGRSLVAYDRESGELAWSGGDDRSGYASPLVATLGGVRQIVILNAASVVGHHPATGAVLWQRPWPAGQPNVAQPLPLDGDRLLVSSGYGVGAEMLSIGPGAAGELEVELVWKSPRLKAKFAHYLEFEGHVYGLDDGVMVCLDPATGERCWKRGRYGHGQMLLVGDLLLVQSERGELVLVEPNPEELTELARFPVIDGKTWNVHTLAGRYLLMRNEREAVMLEMPLRGET